MWGSDLDFFSIGYPIGIRILYERVRNITLAFNLLGYALRQS